MASSEGTYRRIGWTPESRLGAAKKRVLNEPKGCRAEGLRWWKRREWLLLTAASYLLLLGRIKTMKPVRLTSLEHLSALRQVELHPQQRATIHHGA